MVLGSLHRGLVWLRPRWPGHGVKATLGGLEGCWSASLAAVGSLGGPSTVVGCVVWTSRAIITLLRQVWHGLSCFSLRARLPRRTSVSHFLWALDSIGGQGCAFPSSLKIPPPLQGREREAGVVSGFFSRAWLQTAIPPPRERERACSFQLTLFSYNSGYTALLGRGFLGWLGLWVIMA